MSKGYREAVAAQSPGLKCFDVNPGDGRLDSTPTGLRPIYVRKIWKVRRGRNPVGVDFNSMEIAQG